MKRIFANLYEKLNNSIEQAIYRQERLASITTYFVED